MVSKCGSEIAPHIPAIVELCLEYLTYDPNYNYEDGDDSDMECDEENDEGEGTDDEYSDDDDVSWKVRRAAAKCLEAVVVSRHEMIDTFYRTISPALITRYILIVFIIFILLIIPIVLIFLLIHLFFTVLIFILMAIPPRFKEREENVKSDIFHAYIALLRQTKPAPGLVAPDPASMEAEEGPVSLLQAQVGGGSSWAPDGILRGFVCFQQIRIYLVGSTPLPPRCRT